MFDLIRLQNCKAIKIIVKRGLVWSSVPLSCVFTLVPEMVFSNKRFILSENCLNKWMDVDAQNIVLAKLVLAIAIILFCIFCSYVRAIHRKSVRIEENGYSIQIESGDFFKIDNGQKVINFDECYTTKVGERSDEIKQNSICGQYLERHKEIDDHFIEGLIQEQNIKSCNERSLYKGKICYKPGTIVAYKDDLLMAFTRLEKNGISKKFTIEEYLECLDLLWIEINNHYCQKDVYVPLLGSGIARFEAGLSQTIPTRELLDMMINSYKLSTHKIKDTNTLHIVCKNIEPFCLDNYSN